MDRTCRRRLLLGMTLRRAHPGTGSARIFLEDRTAVAHWPDLTETLTGIRWAVVGAVVTKACMAERTTQELDIMDSARTKKRQSFQYPYRSP